MTITEVATEVQPSPQNSSSVATAASPKRIVAIALDDSKYAELAFNHAVNHYIRDDDFVILLNVQHNRYPGVTAGATGLDAFDPSELERAAQASKDDSYALLTRYAKVLAAKKISYRALSVIGPVREGLVHKIKELNATTVIVGSRGANLLSRSLLGSVSNYLAHHCHCPVLVVKPNHAELLDMGVPEHHMVVVPDGLKVI
ncbi:hypothetical protein BDR26DRAFT_858658 [Obelidium mucronatum]|nr:hypothetical protein BDR26DRAFT_858658 [Obelidium mucronatum]